MKPAYLLCVAGFAAAGLLAEGCVSGDTVNGTGGHTGSSVGGKTGGGNSSGSVGGSSFGSGGSSFGSGGFTGGSQGGFTGGSQGGFTGGAGSSGVAGSSGGAGSGVAGCPRTVPDIDNFDEAGRGGPATGGYFNLNCAIGAWYVYGDSTPGATSTPPLSSGGTPFTSDMPGHGGSGYAAHVNASGFGTGTNGFGVGLGVNLNAMGTSAPKSVDASAYSGFTFWAMGTASGTLGANMVRIAVPTPASSSAGNGGTCTVGGTTTYCDGHFGKPITLTSTWTQYTVKWGDLALDSGAGGGPTFTQNAVIGFHWQVNGTPAQGTTAATAAAMNIWVDDLAFTP